jgi:hypothetical protein
MTGVDPNLCSPFIILVLGSISLYFVILQLLYNLICVIDV